MSNEVGVQHVSEQTTAVIIVLIQQAYYYLYVARLISIWLKKKLNCAQSIRFKI